MDLFSLYFLIILPCVLCVCIFMIIVEKFKSKPATDESELYKIAIYNIDYNVRIAAVENLTDQALLAKIVMQTRDEYPRLVAFRKLTDQALLAKIAIEHESHVIRDAAAGKLINLKAHQTGIVK